MASEDDKSKNIRTKTKRKRIVPVKIVDCKISSRGLTYRVQLQDQDAVQDIYYSQFPRMMFERIESEFLESNSMARTWEIHKGIKRKRSSEEQNETRNLGIPSRAPSRASSQASVGHQHEDLGAHQVHPLSQGPQNGADDLPVKMESLEEIGFQKLMAHFEPENEPVVRAIIKKMDVNMEKLATLREENMLEFMFTLAEQMKVALDDANQATPEKAAQKEGFEACRVIPGPSSARHSSTPEPEASLSSVPLPQENEAEENDNDDATALAPSGSGTEGGDRPDQENGSSQDQPLDNQQFEDPVDAESSGQIPVPSSEATMDSIRRGKAEMDLSKDELKNVDKEVAVLEARQLELLNQQQQVATTLQAALLKRQELKERIAKLANYFREVQKLISNID